MTIPEEIIKQFIEAARPTNIETRKKLDYGYSFEKNVAILFEIRPQWNKPTIIQEYPFAKIRFVATQEIWKLYWKRASGKWELYEPFPSSKSLPRILKTIKTDSYGCFFG